MSPISGKPLQIVSLCGDHTYELLESNLKSILLRPEVANKNVIVVSVVGAFRKGKSFLLNFILRYLESGCRRDWLDNTSNNITGFHWRGGVDRATSGILMWSEPFVINGTAVLLMDTQGTFDNQSTVKETCTIFSLSTLLSSIQIYNLQSNLQENDLQHLQLFTEYGRLVLQQTEDTPFQRLIFLIRDWEKEYDHPFGWDGGQQVVSAFLKQNIQHADLQTVREHIAKCFTNVAGFLMVHPGRKVVSQREFSGTLADLEPEFLEQMKLFVPAIFGNFEAARKVVSGNAISCNDLLAYFKVYVQQFASGELPVPKTLFRATAEANNLTALNEAQSLFQQGVATLMSSKELFSQETLQQELESLVQKARTKFQSFKKIGGADISDRYLDDLEKSMTGVRNSCMVQNGYKLERIRIEEKLKTELDAKERQHLEAEREAVRSRAEAAEQRRLAEQQMQQKQQAEDRERHYKDEIGNLRNEVRRANDRADRLNEQFNREQQTRQREQREPTNIVLQIPLAPFGHPFFR